MAFIMVVPIFLSAIGGFITMTASRVISVIAGRKLTEKSSPKSAIKPVKKDERSRKAEADYFRAKSEREQELVNIQADLANMRETELKGNFAIAEAEADREERSLVISEKNLQLRKQELELAKTRLKQNLKLAEGQRQQAEKALQLRQRELQLMQEDLNERRKLSYLNLELQREQEANKIALKLTEIQSNWDRENWAGIISREEMQRLLIDGQKQHRLVMMISPPDISDCPEFNANLQKEVRSEVKEFLEQHYPYFDLPGAGSDEQFENINRASFDLQSNFEDVVKLGQQQVRANLSRYQDKINQLAESNDPDVAEAQIVKILESALLK